MAQPIKTILSRYAVQSVALRFPATRPEKGPVGPTFSALKGGVAVQVAPWKASRCCRTTMGHLDQGVMGNAAQNSTG